MLLGVTMWFSALMPILSGIFGENGPLGQYFKVKAAQVQAEEDYRLAALKSATDQAVADSVADTTQRSNYLASTSQGFRQGTFYWMSGIIFYSIIFPSKADALWANFTLIPQWVQYIYIAMLSVTWGLPVAKENIGLMFSSIGRGIAASRDHQISKIEAINKAQFYDSIRKSMGNGVDQKTVDMLDKAIDAGEQ
jgi:hypothetical protein